MAPENPAASSWSLMVPVKVLAQAKSRLSGLAGQLRAELALAMAGDTIAAAVAASSVADVLVVTDDVEVGDIASGLGAIVLPDLPAAGLNAALGHGAAYSLAHWPGRGLAALAGDLPALRPTELDAAFAAAGNRSVFVPDADGTGTTLYAAGPGADFRPEFGVASRNRHAAGGAVELDLGDLAPGLRRDVDTVDDLREAAVIGLGPRTLAVLTTSGGLRS